MNRLMAGYMVLYLFGSILSSMSEGQNTLATTQLSAGISSTAAVIPVTTVAGFTTETGSNVNQNYIYIDKEIVCFSGISGLNFIVSRRGCNNTTAAPHATNTAVYNTVAGTINAGASPELVQAASDINLMSIVTVPAAFIGAIVKIVTWNYSYLEGQAVYLRAFLIACSAGFLISLYQVFVYPLVSR